MIKLSNGDSLVINDYISEGSPYISAEKEEGDSVYYWAIVNADGSKKWILDPEGNRMPATGEQIAIPTVTPVLNPDDNTYYWNIVSAGDTTFVLDQNGKKVPVTSHEGELSIFKRVDNSYDDHLVIVLANGGTLTIPKIYTIAFSTTSLTMAVSTQKPVTYRVYGADANSQYTLITQGDITATLTQDSKDVEAGVITVKTGATFTGNGKVLLLVAAGKGSTKTMTKSITVALE